MEEGGIRVYLQRPPQTNNKQNATYIPQTISYTTHLNWRLPSYSTQSFIIYNVCGRFVVADFDESPGRCEMCGDCAVRSGAPQPERLSSHQQSSVIGQWSNKYVRYSFLCRVMSVFVWFVSTLYDHHSFHNVAELV